MSQKTSTAALDSFREGQLAIRRRAPRHPAGRKRRSKEARKQRSQERAGEFGQAQIAVYQEGAVNGSGAKRTPGKIRAILPVILRITFCLTLWTLGATTMTIAEAQTRELRVPPEFSVTP